MVDLFRYIEQAFAVPALTDSISVENNSAFQTSLTDATRGDSSYARTREVASAFLEATFTSPAAAPLADGGYLAFRKALLGLHPVTRDAVEQLATQTFGDAPSTLVTSAAFIADKELLQNAVLAVKIVTGFDKVNALTLVRQLQVVAFIETLASGQPADLSAGIVRQILDRSVRISADFLIALPTQVHAPVEPRTGTVDQRSLRSLQAQRDALRATYESLMSLQPSALEMSAAEPARQAETERHEAPAGETGGESNQPAAPQVLRIAPATLERLPVEQRSVLDSLPVDVARTHVAQLVEAVKRQWIDVNRRVLPAEVQAAVKVYSVGTQVFAIATQPLLASWPAPTPAPDFSHFITRPVGFGNLQVVRQELIGYEAGEISHIENVLEGELLKRETRREEVNEVTLTQETSTTQSQQRDQQSTDHNELASETQKESGQQSTSSADQTTSSNYGKLVENTKTGYAKTVTSKAVSNLTQMIRQQRVQREKKTFTDDAIHELDNQKGTSKVRGIYQWVDKKYSVRVLSYGKRLLYDVVVPEPAYFLIQSLKDAVQPETFQLTKPSEPGIHPSDLDASNYSYYASIYGVTGSVAPPPDEFTQTVAHPDAQDVTKELKAFGGSTHGYYYGAFTVQVPAGYKAIGGYIQRTNMHWINANPARKFEFFVGENYHYEFGTGGVNFLSQSFKMNGETGEIPVTMNSFDNVLQFNFAVGINCQRTDKAYEKWQLQTHAAIMAGYQRQLADYLDKLTRYTAAVRAQMAMAGNFAHDPSIEQQELKKAFIYLLLGEQYGAFLPTPPPAPTPPLALPPDPTYVKQWGAMVAFFERAFEWDNIMYTFYPYFWGQPSRWEEMILTQDVDPQFEAFLKAGAARVVIPVRPGFEAGLAHFQETGDVWLGEEIPDMFSDYYVSIIAEIKAANYAPGAEVCVDQWEVTVPTTLVLLKDDAALPSWPKTPCTPPPAS